MRLRNSLREVTRCFPLKKYRDGGTPVSKISDNIDPAAALGDAEMPRVQHSPGAVIPAFGHVPEDGGEIFPPAAAEHAEHVFPDEPARAFSLSNSDKVEGQVATRVIQPESVSRNGKRLAWRPPDEEVDACALEEWLLIYFRHVSEVGYVRVALRQNGVGERLYLREPRWPPSK